MHDFGLIVLGAGCGGTLTTWALSLRVLLKAAKRSEAQR